MAKASDGRVNVATVTENWWVTKRDGREVPFNKTKIADAIFKAAVAVGGSDRNLAEQLADKVVFYLAEKFSKNIFHIEEIQDVVEKILIEEGHAKTAKAYILYREKRARARRELKVRKKAFSRVDSTDISLMVTAPAQEEISNWDANRIAEALVREADLSEAEARKIAHAVERRVIDLDLKVISTGLIRELVDTELLERGLQKKWQKQKVIGMPIHDLRQLIYAKSNENSNISSNNPEAINLAIAENAIKHFMLQEVFNEKVAFAHLEGLIHIHDLGYPRIYCSGHSIEYLKKYGLQLDNLDTSSAPAKHARTLTGHLNTFFASMQAFYAGALGAGYVNIFYAPFVRGMSYKEMIQEAQYLIFSSSQNAFSRGGQSLFLDFNVHLGIPSYLRDVPVVGPGGKYTGETYKDYESEAQEFLRAMMDVWRAGDQNGQVFAFPKMDLHIDDAAFKEPKQRELLEYACQIASENGTPYFIFDRDAVSLAACCRLRTTINDDSMIKYPERMRFAGIQNVTINLPQCAYRAKKSAEGDIFSEIKRAMELAVEAHLAKKEFLAQLMDEPGKPLWQIGKIAKDGRPYVELEKGTYLVGLIGLNECVQYLTGKQLHEDNEAYKLGLQIVAFMNLKCRQFREEYGLKFSLEETPAESAARRLAKIDLKEYPESERVVKGSVEEDTCYYTNSIHLAPDAPIDFIERIILQSKFHPLIESGAIIHAFVGEKRPSAAAIFNLIQKTWLNTQCAQVTISPEFTICNSCARMSDGLQKKCLYCGSLDVDGLTRIVGYFSKLSNWNKSKLAELGDRHRGSYLPEEVVYHDVSA
jgi:ribonucleoside-triphosphate reductase